MKNNPLNHLHRFHNAGSRPQKLHAIAVMNCNLELDDFVDNLMLNGVQNPG
jgi:hypothetical protein